MRSHLSVPRVPFVPLKYFARKPKMKGCAIRVLLLTIERITVLIVLIQLTYAPVVQHRGQHRRQHADL